MIAPNLIEAWTKSLNSMGIEKIVLFLRCTECILWWEKQVPKPRKPRWIHKKKIYPDIQTPSSLEILDASLSTSTSPKNISNWHLYWSSITGHELSRNHFKTVTFQMDIYVAMIWELSLPRWMSPWLVDRWKRRVSKCTRTFPNSLSSPVRISKGHFNAKVDFNNNK